MISGLILDIDFVLYKVISGGQEESDLLDLLDKISTIVIAFLTLIFSVYIYIVTSKKEKKKNEEGRHIDLLKTLILDHNLGKFYVFFDNVINHSNELLVRPLSDPEKMIINDLYLEELTIYRLKFYELLKAVDDNLYQSIKDNADDLIDQLTLHLSNSNLNLNIPSVYQDNIVSTVTTFKTEAIRILFNYR